jgi:hypothetical protein
MKLRTLSIGNSFSQDACGYLHQIAASMNIEWECVNLYIGGCSLETHAANLASGAPAYSLEINGTATGTMISVSDALKDGTYDIVTLQQASHYRSNGLRFGSLESLLICQRLKKQENTTLFFSPDGHLVTTL